MTSRAEIVEEMIEGLDELLQVFGESIEVGTYDSQKNSSSGFRSAAAFTKLATSLGVLMPVTEQQRRQLLAAGGVPDSIPPFVAYLPMLPFTLTAAHKLHYRGKYYDPTSPPSNIGGADVGWEIFLRASV